MITLKSLPLGYMGMEIPHHTQQTLENYLLRGWKPGGFCESMLAYDYERALYTADTANRQMFWAIAMWIRDFAPDHSHGSYASIDIWCEDVNGCRTKYVNEVEKDYVWNTLKGQA